MELSSMTAVTPPLVDEASESAAAAILARDVNFASYFTAGLLSDRDVQLLRRYDKKDKFTQSSLLEKVRPWPLQWRDRPLALLLRRSRRFPRWGAALQRTARATGGDASWIRTSGCSSSSSATAARGAGKRPVATKALNSVPRVGNARPLYGARVLRRTQANWPGGRCRRRSRATLQPR